MPASAALPAVPQPVRTTFAAVAIASARFSISSWPSRTRRRNAAGCSATSFDKKSGYRPRSTASMRSWCETVIGEICRIDERSKIETLSALRIANWSSSR